MSTILLPSAMVISATAPWRSRGHKPARSAVLIGSETQRQQSFQFQFQFQLVLCWLGAHRYGKLQQMAPLMAKNVNSEKFRNLMIDKITWLCRWIDENNFWRLTVKLQKLFCTTAISVPCEDALVCAGYIVSKYKSSFLCTENVCLHLLEYK